MKFQNEQSRVRAAIDIAISLAMVAVILGWCLLILRPFASIIIWAAIIAIALYKPFLMLRKALGDKQKPAVVLFAALGLATVLIPAWLFMGSIVDTATHVTKTFESGEIQIPPPNESVRAWPLIGERAFQQWSEAALNFGDWLESHRSGVKAATTTVLSKLAGIGLGALQFVVSIIIAAAMLANADTISAGMKRLFRRVIGDTSDDMQNLITATVRSVTVGVLGIAFIQALLGGLGMLAVGVPAAGVWALIILVLGIAQLPPLLVLLPAIIYVFSVESTTVAAVFAIWSVLVSFSDAVLKPMFLGRGVEAPMLVILLGAVGGLLLSGIVGLFVGAVVLAIGYMLMVQWISTGEDHGPEAETGVQEAVEHDV